MFFSAQCLLDIKVRIMGLEGSELEAYMEIPTPLTCSSLSLVSVQPTVTYQFRAHQTWFGAK